MRLRKSALGSGGGTSARERISGLIASNAHVSTDLLNDHGARPGGGSVDDRLEEGLVRAGGCEPWPSQMLLQELDTSEAVREEVQRLGGEQRSHLYADKDGTEFATDNMRLVCRNTKEILAQGLWRSRRRNKRAEHTAANIAALGGFGNLLRSVCIHKVERIVSKGQGSNPGDIERRRAESSGGGAYRRRRGRGARSGRAEILGTPTLSPPEGRAAGRRQWGRWRRGDTDGLREPGRVGRIGLVSAARVDAASMDAKRSLKGRPVISRSRAKTGVKGVKARLVIH